MRMISFLFISMTLLSCIQGRADGQKAAAQVTKEEKSPEAEAKPAEDTVQKTTDETLKGEEEENPLPPPEDPEEVKKAYSLLLKGQKSYVKKGVPAALLQRTLDYFGSHQHIIGSVKAIGIIDYTRSSLQKRFWIINIETGRVTSLYVAHGRGSDPDDEHMVKTFSNVEGSLATSKGFFLTSERYIGDHGLAMKMDGLEETNSNARMRDIVIHGAAYVRGELGKVGRSHGCPAVAFKDIARVVDAMEDGALLYAHGN